MSVSIHIPTQALTYRFKGLELWVHSQPTISAPLVVNTSFNCNCRTPLLYSNNSFISIDYSELNERSLSKMYIINKMEFNERDDN